MTEHPKVFISYSHDSPAHKRWVSQLGAKLRDKGVDATLDQWNLGLGDDVTRFMEHGIRNSDRVLVICTDNYVSKANAGEGGVGYERMIVTAQLVQDLGTNKFIPIIRQASGQEKMPTCLETRVYIDFTDDNQFDAKFNELLHELYQVPIVQKPPLGEKPSFAQSSSGQEAPPSEGLNPQLLVIPNQVESASYAYSVAFELARAGDVVGWRQLIERTQPRVFNSLVQWRQTELDGHQPEHKKLVEVSHKAVEIIAPLISVALMGVKSRIEQFKDQKSILYDLLNIPGWSDAGYIRWVSIRHTLGYVYHSLHGSLCLNTNQLDLALSLAQDKISVADGIMPSPVWKNRVLMGWSRSLGPDCIKGWKYLAEAYEEWKEWLSPIFADELEYRTALVAYYMALHIHELAEVIASGQQDTLSSRYEIRVPLTFVSDPPDINERAIALLLRNSESLRKLWTSLDVTREEMKKSWRDWIRSSGGWLEKIYGPSSTRVYHENLFEAL